MMLSMNPIPDKDIEFLESQREDLAQSSMAGVNQNMLRKMERKTRLEVDQFREQRAAEEQAWLQEKTVKFYGTVK